MSNELLFVLHIIVVMTFVIGSLRWGAFSLIALIAIQAILANLFVVKQIPLLGFTVTCSDVFAIGSILALNLAQEYFGKEIAQKAVKISFLGLVFFGVMGPLHLWYLPASVDVTQTAFETILTSAPRIVFASLTVFFLVQKLDIFLFGVLKRLFQGQYLSFRMMVSLGISQLVDTVFFSFLGLYGLVDSMMDVILVSFCLKALIIFMSLPFIALLKKWKVYDSLSI